jgi:hypothetical protein
MSGASTDIGNLGLSVRALKALRWLKVRTVREFLRLDLSSIGHISNCGVTTREHLARVQDELRRQSDTGLSEASCGSAEAVRDIVKQPAKPILWKELPLFSGRPNPGIVPDDLHETYHADTPIERLALTGRVQRAVTEKRITSLGQLLLTPGTQLIGRHHLGSGTLAKTRSLVDAFLRDSLTDFPRIEADVRTPEGFLRSLLTPIVSDERQRHVLLERMGWQSEPRTLEELSHELRLTKERIRQIERAALQKLRHWQATNALRPLHDLVVSMLRDLSPLMSVSEIGRQLQRRFGWSRPIHAEALGRLLLASPTLRFVDRRYICNQSFHCVDCPVLPSVLNTVLSHNIRRQVDLPTLAQRFLRATEDCKRCRRCAERPTKPSVDLVRIAFARSSAAMERCRLVRNELWTFGRWPLPDIPWATATEMDESSSGRRLGLNPKTIESFLKCIATSEEEKR